MAKYEVTFSGDGDLEDLDFNTITDIGKFLGGTFTVVDSHEAIVESNKDITAKFVNTALAKYGVLNLSVSSIEKI